MQRATIGFNGTVMQAHATKSKPASIAFIISLLIVFWLYEDQAVDGEYRLLFKILLI